MQSIFATFDCDASIAATEPNYEKDDSDNNKIAPKLAETQGKDVLPVRQDPSAVRLPLLL